MTGRGERKKGPIGLGENTTAERDRSYYGHEAEEWFYVYFVYFAYLEKRLNPNQFVILVFTSIIYIYSL